MAISVNDFVEGLDPSILAQISGAQLLQLIRNATPEDSRGIVICDDATPDTTTYPRFKNYLWVRPSDDPPILRAWNWTSSAWEQPQSGQVSADSITTAMLQDASVTLPKLSTSGGTALYIIRVNAAGTAFEFVPFVPDDNSVELDHFKIVTGTAKKLIRVNSAGTAFEYATIEEIVQASTTDNWIEPEDLALGTTAPAVGQTPKFLGVAYGETTFSANFLLATHIAATGGAIGQVIGVLPGGTVGFMDVDETEKYVSAETTINNALETLPFTHGLNAVPAHVEAVLVCKTTELGYAVDEEVKVEAFQSNDNDQAFTVSKDDETIRVWHMTNSDIKLRHRSTGTVTQITLANWKLKVYASRID